MYNDWISITMYSSEISVYTYPIPTSYSGATVCRGSWSEKTDVDSLTLNPGTRPKTLLD